MHLKMVLNLLIPPTYGVSEKTIGLSKKKFSIITKIPKIPKKLKMKILKPGLKK